jgi:hypothetical protein
VNTRTPSEPWQLFFDQHGHVDPDGERKLAEQIRVNGIADLVLFSHGWNNDERAAKSLYGRWFDLLNAQIESNHSVGFVGIRWPSQLWRDEPIPNFDASRNTGGDGAASLLAAPTVRAGAPSLTMEELQDLKEVFPEASNQLDTIAALLAAEPDSNRSDELFAALKAFSDATPSGFNDGESPESNTPAMLETDQPDEVLSDFADHLLESGVVFDDEGDGYAGLGGDLARTLWQGAKEALRQLSYWKMKNRAGVIGQKGVGPLIERLSREFPTLRFHLIGHSFGARVVAFALTGVPDAETPVIKSVTLLQGAFSRFAFADSLPFNSGTTSNAGALAGKLARIDGPLTVCFSSHDVALGTFYPVASFFAGDAYADVFDPLMRWRAMGQLGAYGGSDTKTLGNVGASYEFKKGAIFNVDASEVVRAGDPPSGAHSDIFHPQLAWLAAAAGGLNRPEAPVMATDPT